MLRHASSLSTPLRCRAEPPDEGCGARTMPNDENVDKNWEGFSEVRVDTRTHARGETPRELLRHHRLPPWKFTTESRRASLTRPHPPAQVQELTKKNENLIRALDDANRQVAELSARFETGGPGPAADARESKIVEVSKKNRALTLSVERERAEKLRALAQLKSAQVRLDTLDSERTETEVERACREVVEEASKATEAAQNELAAMREKWKQASARAERFGGQNAFIKTENDRLKVIIRREVGEHVDFGRLDDEIAATGGKKGRALTIRDLNMKIGLLRVQLAEANDALAAVAAAPETMELPTVGGEETNPPERRVEEPSHSGPVAGSDQDQDQDVHHHAEEDDAQKEKERSDLREASRAAAAASARLDAQARRLEATSLELARLRDALATEKEDATLLAKMNRNLETEVRSLLEKVVVLKDKSDHDDRLVDALRDETARTRAEAEDDAISEVSEQKNRSRFEPFVSGGDKNAVPLAEYRSMEARALSLEAKLLKQEQILLHARAKNASLEQALERATRSDGLSPDEAFSPAAIAAAAGAGAGADARRDEDIANLIEHSEALERVCQEMKGKLLVAEKQVAQLREQVQAERRKYQDATRRLAGAGDTGGEGGNAAALRAALAEAEAETQRVRSKYEGKLEEMEREVELYAEMMTEMKRAASANASRGGSPAPMRRKGLPG